MKLAAVSYLNTKPFLEGLRTQFPEDDLEVHELVPAACAQVFLSGKVDVALVPAAALLSIPKPHLLSRWCIGAAGQVDSVYIFSQVPIEQVDYLLPDVDSLTSNLLARILLRDLWQRDITLLDESPDWQSAVRNNTAAVVIGDKAVQARNDYAYRYDLAEAWYRLTGLPFVFAVWVYLPAQVSIGMLDLLTQSFDWGIRHREQVAHRWANHFGLSPLEALHYFEHSISYELDDAKQEALARYLTLGAALEKKTSPQLVMA